LPGIGYLPSEASAPETSAPPVSPSSKPGANKLALVSPDELGRAPLGGGESNLPDLGAGLKQPRLGGVNLRRGDTLAGSILNREGRGNISGEAAVWSQVPGRGVRLDGDGPVVNPAAIVDDPNSVMSNVSWGGIHPEVKAILSDPTQAARAGEAVADKMLELYGPFTATNSKSNRDAIIDNLQWIASSYGVEYDYERLRANTTDTQPPNDTIGKGTGSCRDTHVATSAILGALMSATPKAGGGFQLGSPTGAQGNVQAVQTVAFSNPDEFHAYMVYRDPISGNWNALEYGKHYALGDVVKDNNALDAMRNLPGYAPGYTRFTVTGWNSPPAVNDRGAIGAIESNQFFEDDAGVGIEGENRISVAGSMIKATHFISDRVAIVGQIDAGALNDGVKGGVKLNWHRDLEKIDRRGYLHAAAGLYTDYFDASQFTGARGKDDRVGYQVYVLAVQADGRIQAEPHQLLGEHLRLNWGADWNTRLGVPFAEGGSLGFGLMSGAIGDYSAADVGADVGLSGNETLSPELALEWAVQGRAKLDLIAIGTEAVTSQVGSVERTLSKDPLRTDFAAALIHTPEDGPTTRFEIGGTQLVTDPYDPETDATENHYLALSIEPQSGDFSAGVVARGASLDGDFAAINRIAVAIDLKPTDNVSVGASVDASAPGGDWKKAGANAAFSIGVRANF